MAKITIKTVKGFRLKGWTAVLVCGFLLTIIAMIDNGGFTSTPVVPPADGSTGCQYRVVVTTPDANGKRELNVRTEPSATAPIKGTVPDGTLVDTTNVVTNGYRQLKGGLWAAADHLTRVTGDNCG